MRGRAIAALFALALASCTHGRTYGAARATLAAEESQALDVLLDRSGIDPATLVVSGDLYDLFWRGGPSYAGLHGAADRAEAIERATRDPRNTVVVEGGHVRALRIAGGKLDDLRLVAPLRHLVVLDLHDQQIDRVDGLDGMAELDHLDLSGNRIASTEGLGALHALRSLYLADNRLKRIESLDALRSLEVLNLSGNAIAELDGVASLPALRALSMERNPIQQIDGLAGANQLTDLDLAFCQITRIENLVTVPKLLYLNLWHNQVRSLSGVEDATNLIYLGLGENDGIFNDPESVKIRDRFCVTRLCVFL
jgi:Leucine Rich repeats (2 copies)